MSTEVYNDVDSPRPVTDWQTLVIGAVAIIAGTLLSAVALPNFLPGLTASILGNSPKVYWYLSRSSAMVAFILLWMSMTLGLILTNRLARIWPGGLAATDLHQYVSLLGLGLGCFHGLILLGDHYMKPNLIQIMLPFANQNYKPGWVGLGQLAFYTWLLVLGSFYVRKRIGRSAWRGIHFISFLTFALALIHGLMSGTDSQTLWASALYWFAGGSLLVLLFYRILVTIEARKTIQGKPVIVK
jgi:predicted ferric reductase